MVWLEKSRMWRGRGLSHPPTPRPRRCGKAAVAAVVSVLAGNLFAMTMKMPPAAESEPEGRRLASLTERFVLGTNQMAAVSAVIREVADRAAADRTGSPERAEAVERARARHELFREKMGAILAPDQREKLRVLDRLWDDLDGDLLWIMERCRLTEEQTERVGLRLLAWRRNHPPRTEALENGFVFPDGDEGRSILELLTDPQQKAWVKVRDEMERARAEQELSHRANRTPGGREAGNPMPSGRRSAAGGAGF